MSSPSLAVRPVGPGSFSGPGASPVSYRKSVPQEVVRRIIARRIHLFILNISLCLSFFGKHRAGILPQVLFDLSIILPELYLAV